MISGLGQPWNDDDLNTSVVLRGIADRDPTRPCVIGPEVSVSFGELCERGDRVARGLVALGLGGHRSRRALQPWESGQAHVGLMLGNDQSHVDALLGCWTARAAPAGINHRYTAPELRQMIDIARLDALVYDSSLAAVVGEALDGVGRAVHVVEVGAQPGALLDGAIRLEDLDGSGPLAEPSGSDLHLLCTGGTTGLPKVVLWRHADFIRRIVPARGIDPEAIVAATERRAPRTLPGGALIHAAGQWAVVATMLAGGTTVFTTARFGFDAAAALDAVAEHDVNVLSIVGDAFGVPLIQALERAGRPLPSLRTITTGGVAMRPDVKQRLCDLLPDIRIVELLGSSETGFLAENRSTREGVTVDFEPRPGTIVLGESLRTAVEPGSEEIGWIAVAGAGPLGYLDDPAATRRTFPSIDGVRYVVGGDRATVGADGRIALLGRDSTTINTGGEKVFAEEVESVLRDVPGVEDVSVVGRPSQRWGSEVVAVVASVNGATVSLSDLLAGCDGRLARYKWPRTVVDVAAIPRLATGKVDRPAVLAMMSERSPAEPSDAP